LRRRGKTENIRTVTLEDAWRELGVDPGADGDGVRRAYLRLIKTRKPESDPVGFQRAREAFEIARAGSEIEAIAAFGGRRRASVFARPPGATGAPAPDAAPAPTAAPPPAAGTPGATTAADVPPSRSGRPGVPDLILPDAGQSRADIIFDGFSSAWHSVPASADQRKRLEIAREAVAVLPDDPRAHWMLVTTLSRLGPDAALADALRAGWNAGWPDFLEALLVRLPARATREEIDAGFASPRPELQLAAAAASANWNAPRAAALVVDLCRSAMDAALGARDDRVRDLPVSRMLDLILALHGAGALDAATDAQKALRDCLHDSGLEIALMHGPLGGVWTLAEEIGGLPRDFPQGLRTAFASATRSGDLSSAFIDSCRAVERDRSGVRLWSDKLTATAPNVSAILRGALTQQRATSVNRTGFQISRLSYLLVPMLLAFGRLCASSFDEPHDTGPLVTNTGRPYNPATTPTLPMFGTGATGVGIEMLSQAANDLCGADGPRHGQLVCADVEALVATLEGGLCGDVPGRVAKIRRALNGRVGDLESRFLSRMTMTRWQVCGAGAPADNAPSDTTDRKDEGP
jgi:hypothetical protein